MDELKHQGGVAEYPTVVRVLVHLQDVRVLAVGVLADKPSYYVNPNAHFVVHPPLLRPVSERPRPPRPTTLPPHPNSLPPPGTGPSGIPAPPPRANSVSFAIPVAAVPGPSNDSAATSAAESFFPLTRTSSAGSTGGNSDTGSRRSSLFGSFSWRVGRRRSVDENAEAGPSFVPLARTRSRDSERRRSWGFGLSRTQSLPTVPTVPAAPPVPILTNASSAGARSTEGGGAVTVTSTTNAANGSNAAAAPTAELEQLSIESSSPTQPTTPSVPVATPLPTLPEDNSDPPTPPTPEPSPPSRRRRFPYRPIEYPTPAYSHAQYPNYTPFEEDPEETTLEALRRVRDFRSDHREVEEDMEDRVWSGNEGIWGADSEAMAEWDLESSGRQRWVGPMM